MFEKGFKLTKGQATHPTDFCVIDKKFDNSNGRIILVGKMRDNDDPKYYVALNTEKGKTTVEVGHNQTGDWVVLELRELIHSGKDW